MVFDPLFWGDSVNEISGGYGERSGTALGVLDGNRGAKQLCPQHLEEGAPAERVGHDGWTASSEKSGTATSKSRPAASLEKPALLEAWTTFLRLPAPHCPAPSRALRFLGEEAMCALLLQAPIGSGACVPRTCH